jgi:carbonic anhydrase/acetyltransferase-like protein (isoleucine patch superfamily)
VILAARAGALVPQGMAVPPRSLVAGVARRVRRQLSDTGVAPNRHNASAYERLLELRPVAL